MTAPQLLFYIVAALLIQLAAGVGFVVWRRHGSAALAPVSVADEVSERVTGAWSGWREFRVARRVFEDRSRSMCSFHLEPVDGVALPPFRPGQFLTFMLQVAGTDGPHPDGQRTITRCYSLSDRPDPKEYRVTIKRVLPPTARPDVPAGVSSSHFHDRVREGDVLKVKAPAGHFFIDPDPNIPAVLIAGGVGITPVMAMLRSLTDRANATSPPTASTGGAAAATNASVWIAAAGTPSSRSAAVTAAIIGAGPHR